ncbi:UNVERIFIED_CONTAM: hypothetical protein FKN15_051383 [Acipenser sinensis]
MDSTTSRTSGEEDGYYNYEDYLLYAVCQKEDVKAFGRIFLPVLYTFVCVFGLIGNGLLAGILIRYIKLKSMTNIYLLNLAISDLLFAATLPFWAAYAQSQWYFGNIGCKVITLIYTINFYSSILFITCMSLDRYLEIAWAFSTKNLRTTFKSCIICTAVWSISILASVPDSVFIKLQHHDGQGICIHDYGDEHMSVWKVILQFKLNVLGFLLPFLAIFFFYSRIACIINKTGSKQKSKALKLVVTLVVVFFVLWFPYNMVLFLHSLQDLHVISDCKISKDLDIALQVTESLAFVHSSLNPFLYAFVNKKFRKYLNNIAKNICRRGTDYSLKFSSTSPPTTQIEMNEMAKNDTDNT